MSNLPDLDDDQLELLRMLAEAPYVGAEPGTPAHSAMLGLRGMELVTYIRPRRGAFIPAQCAGWLHAAITDAGRDALDVYLRRAATPAAAGS